MTGNIQTQVLKYLRTLKNRKIRVIITDDHALFRWGVKTALKPRTDIQIIGEAGNGRELLDLLNTVVPDIVIIGIQMPVMDGIEALPLIKKKCPDLKVIVLSMHNAPEIIAKMMHLGANSYLTKNTNSDIIYQAIRCVFEYNYYYSKAIESAFLGAYNELPKQGNELTAKELQILDFLKENKTVKEMAELMDITERTVATIMDKFKRTMSQ